MRDLSLHILDLIENSVRAGATVVAVTIQADPRNDLLRVTIEDNGPGFPMTPDKAWDPFFTTKGKKTGLGLSLFRATADLAGGGLELGASPLGGAMVAATMTLSHVDRPPMGDLPATLASVAMTNPQVDLRVALVGDGRFSIDPGQAAGLLSRPDGSIDLSMAGKLAELVRAGMQRVWNGMTV